MIKKNYLHILHVYYHIYRFKCIFPQLTTYNILKSYPLDYIFSIFSHNIPTTYRDGTIQSDIKFLLEFRMQRTIC